MLLQHNIDRNDAAYNTKAPFRYQCPLALPTGSLPDQSIRAAVVYCDEDAAMPVRVSTLAVDPEVASCCMVGFMDASGRNIGTAYLYKSVTGFITTFILDQYETIRGHVSYNSDAADAMLQAAVMSGGSFTTGNNDFVLLPQCHVAGFRGHLRAIRINGQLTHRNVVFYPRIEMRSEVVTADLNAGLASNSYVMSLAEPMAEAGTTFDTNPAFNGICWLSTNNLYSMDGDQAPSPTYTVDNPFMLAGVHLVIRSSDTSNIRVISTDRYTTFTGVLDV